MPLTVTTNLDDYIRLLWQANKSPLLSDNFCLITRDQFSVIKQAIGWDTIVSIVPVDQDEIQKLHQMGLFKVQPQIGEYFKLYQMETWLSICVVDSQRRERIRKETEILIVKERRITEALTKLQQAPLCLSNEIARVTMYDHVLKGNMPMIAEMLGIKDLVNWKMPEII